ncbi:hypothetical protein [Pseudorhodoplanes sp.]|uniref:hypothetical protein n=1 Tax=Pseudorhodoplanes sp. TaxID=1934341 RepID=UPI002CB23AAC|nr:hypothetical protein [Pseudorhodoplanes sp.]HWV44163.1 hypothetical protein [Pseudorhodoplanes sp.]
MSEQIDRVWVLWWQYLDKSGSGVMRAYSDVQRAQEDRDLCDAEASGKQYFLDELPIYASPPSTENGR